MNIRRSISVSFISLLALSAGNSAALAQGTSYHIELPQYRANPGNQLTVPVILHDASGLARVRIQVNFNPDVIQFHSINAGPLGDSFDFEYETDGGSLTLDFTRSENLVSGSGHLAHIKFTANSGATTDLYSDLAIAKFEIGDETGVTDLTVDNTLILENGSVHVSADEHLDNAGNGLPDWWEEAHSLNPFSTLATDDLDGDSIINLFELAFGGNPNAKDDVSLLPFGATSTFNETDYLSLKFRRRADESDGLIYQLYESTDLVTWYPRSITDLRIQTVDLGSGMELITVRSTNPMTGPESVSKCFLKLDIQ